MTFIDLLSIYARSLSDPEPAGPWRIITAELLERLAHAPAARQTRAD